MGYVSNEAYLKYKNEEGIPELVAYVKKHTTPSERIWLWAYHSEVYYYSERLPACRFITPWTMRFSQVIPLMKPGFPLAEQWTNQIQEMMRDRPPKLIITESEPPEKTGGRTGMRMFPPPAELWWLDAKSMMRNLSPMPPIPPPGAESTRPALFTMLEKALSERYQKVASFARFEIHERRP